MNSNTIITDDMTLEQKLAAIDAAMASAVEQAKEESETNGTPYVPVDPAEATMCLGCQ
jgi:hypothetical protein